MSYVRLTTKQLRIKKFDHPAFQGCNTYTLAELTEMTDKVLAGGDTEELILALRSPVRWLVGRYLWHWPITRKLVNEMVGEGMLALVMMVKGLRREMLDVEGMTILKLTSSRARHRIESVVNDLQSLSAPDVRHQRKLKKAGGSPIYLSVERSPLHEDKATDHNDQEQYEMLEALSELRDECSMAADILNPTNWGLTDTELAAKLGVSRRTINLRRNLLLKQYLLMIGD